MSKLISEFEKERTNLTINWETEIHHFSTSKYLCTCDDGWKSQCCCLFNSHQELALHRDMQFGTDKRSNELRFYDGSKMRINVQLKKPSDKKQSTDPSTEPLADLVECLTLSDTIDTKAKRMLMDAH